MAGTFGSNNYQEKIIINWKPAKEHFILYSVYRLEKNLSNTLFIFLFCASSRKLSSLTTQHRLLKRKTERKLNRQVDIYEKVNFNRFINFYRKKNL